MSFECQCEAAGWCPVIKEVMAGRRYEICSGKAGLPDHLRNEYLVHWGMIQEPGLMQRAASLVKAGADWTAAGFATRSAVEINSIYDTICGPCSERKSTSNPDVSECLKCGCQIGRAGTYLNKIALATENCPLGKWKVSMPAVTKETSIAEVKRLIKEDLPGNWPEGFLDFPNVRQAHREMLDEFISKIKPCPKRKYKGRGIVISVNAKSGWSSGKNLIHGYLPGAWILVKELRRLGCKLPITFAYLGDLEWDDYLTRMVKPLGVECLNLRECERKDPMRILAGWETKIYAMLKAPYAECLFLDADNLPLRDPTYLFDDEHYQRHGAMFWPDVPPSRRKEWVPPLLWDSVGLEYRPYVDFESGQILVDIPNCWEEMQTTRFLNEHSDYWYAPGHCFGDKTTWFLAWQKLGSIYAIPPKLPGWNGGALLQHDMKGQVIFQHCVRNKPTLSGYPRAHCVTHAAHINSHLDELRGLWQGALWHNYEPTGAEWKLAHKLLGKRFIYRRVGIGERPIVFGPGGKAGGKITEGAAGCETRWEVMGKRLAICSDSEPTCVLTEDGKGVWRGKWLRHEESPVELVPLKGS